jgi:hypothetical protein
VLDEVGKGEVLAVRGQGLEGVVAANVEAGVVAKEIVLAGEGSVWNGGEN